MSMLKSAYLFAVGAFCLASSIYVMAHRDPTWDAR